MPDIISDDAPDTPKVAAATTPPTAFLPTQSSKAAPAFPSPTSSVKDMEAAVTDLMLGNSAFGATPMGGSVKKIKDIIMKTMIPKVKAAHSADVREMKRLHAEFAKCKGTLMRSRRAAKGPFALYGRNSNSHRNCRSDEAVKFTTKKNCLTAQKNLFLIKKAKCGTFSTLSTKLSTTKDNRGIVTKAGGESIESYITRISVTICGKHTHGRRGNKKDTGGWGGGLRNGFLDQYWRAKDACDKAEKKWKAKVKECKAKVAAWKKRKGQCDQFQKLMDSNSCKAAIMNNDACQTFSECYNNAYRTYTTTVKVMKKNVVDRKAEWRGLHRMACLINAFSDGKVTGGEVDACKAKAVSEKPMDIRYLPVPPRTKCHVSQLYPATGAYKRKEFAPLPMLAKGMEAVECQGIQEISLRPRKGSPSKCKCERVIMNGAYSAKAMVKCTNCIDVRRVSDKDSCPKGTKIFSPASKSDWQTFLASAGRLAAPHFIVDVTKPTGGGRRSNDAMNSGNRKQRANGWRTSDGAPWWLRSSGYGEPNGDYHANCYLGIGSTRVNAMTFNDHNCHYHSKSYYCQLKRIDLKPAPGSPSSCKCQVVDLTGSYKPGKLVRCNECRVVRRSTDVSSCPKGMKIFSPTSAADWRTFIKSAAPLNAPHFIIDVTRGSDGCQRGRSGCEKSAMNSKNPKQSTWRTQDRSPWWLRSSSYGQPDGNYKANCYLHLWRTPHNSESNIQFDDNQCHYHSRSYYCQPRMKSRAAIKAEERKAAEERRKQKERDAKKKALAASKISRSINLGNGVYASLDNVNPNARYGRDAGRSSSSCHSSSYAAAIPKGWELAPYNRAVLAYPWSTHVLVFKDGRAWGGKDYSQYRQFGGGGYLRKKGNKYYSGVCSGRIIIRKKPVCYAILCEHSNYKGKCVRFNYNKGKSHWSSMKGTGMRNDAVSSVKVRGDRGCRLTIFEHNGYRGRRHTYSYPQVNVPYVGRSWNDKVSSFDVKMR